MKLKEIKELDDTKLAAELAALRGKVRDMRFGLANRQVKNIREIRGLKKQIAQILTIMKHRQQTK
jgi:large subunit ribosomal protein L29